MKLNMLSKTQIVINDRFSSDADRDTLALYTIYNIMFLCLYFSIFNLTYKIQANVNHQLNTK